MVKLYGVRSSFCIAYASPNTQNNTATHHTKPQTTNLPTMAQRTANPRTRGNEGRQNVRNQNPHQSRAKDTTGPAAAIPIQPGQQPPKPNPGRSRKVPGTPPKEGNRQYTNICGAKKKDNTPCNNPAGKGTDHPGFGTCKFHGGNTPSHRKNADKKKVQQRMEKYAHTYGAPIDVDPHEALLQEVSRTAGHVEWLAKKIGEMEESELHQYTVKDGMKMSEWLEMYQEERKMLVTVCRTAIAAGVAEKRVKLAEDQGKMIAAMFMALINDDRLELTPRQRLVAPTIAGQLLRSIPSDRELIPAHPLHEPADAILDVETVD